MCVTWMHMQVLSDLGLGNNSLTGELPEQWAQGSRWENLTRLDVYSNTLTGTLPNAWSDWSILPQLSLWGATTFPHSKLYCQAYTVDLSYKQTFGGHPKGSLYQIVASRNNILWAKLEWDQEKSRLKRETACIVVSYNASLLYCKPQYLFSMQHSIWNQLQLVLLRAKSYMFKDGQDTLIKPRLFIWALFVMQGSAAWKWFLRDTAIFFGTQSGVCKWHISTSWCFSTLQGMHEIIN